MGNRRPGGGDQSRRHRPHRARWAFESTLPIAGNGPSATPESGAPAERRTAHLPGSTTLARGAPDARVAHWSYFHPVVKQACWNRPTACWSVVGCGLVGSTHLESARRRRRSYRQAQIGWSSVFPKPGTCSFTRSPAAPAKQSWALRCIPTGLLGRSWLRPSLEPAGGINRCMPRCRYPIAAHFHGCATEKVWQWTEAPGYSPGKDPILYGFFYFQGPLRGT